MKRILLIILFTPTIALFAQKFKAGDVLIGLHEESPQIIKIIKDKKNCVNPLGRVFKCYEVNGLKFADGTVNSIPPAVDFIDKYYLKTIDYENFDISKLNIKQGQVYKTSHTISDEIFVEIIDKIEMKKFGKSKIAVPAFSNSLYVKGNSNLLANIFDIINNRPLGSDKIDLSNSILVGTVTNENKPDIFSGIWTLTNKNNTVIAKIIFLIEGKYLVPKGGFFYTNIQLEEGDFVFDSEKNQLIFSNNLLWETSEKSKKFDDERWSLKKISDKKFQFGEFILERIY